MREQLTRDKQEPFDESAALSELAELNSLLQNKCPNLEIRIGSISKMKGKLSTYPSRSKHQFLVCLFYEENCISSIQIIENEGIEIRSYTDADYNGKKYNTLLRIVVAIIGNKIKINGKYIHTLYSSATNPISAHL